MKVYEIIKNSFENKNNIENVYKLSLNNQYLYDNNNEISDNNKILILNPKDFIVKIMNKD